MVFYDSSLSSISAISVSAWNVAGTVEINYLTIGSTSLEFAIL
jgi:hypothetical protein